MDNDSRIPISVHLHMLFCGECRRLITLLNENLEAIYKNPSQNMEKDMSEKIMNEVYSSEVKYGQHISALQWAVVGFLILISMLLMPFNDYFGWLRYYFGAGLEVPVSIALGIAISIYAITGILSNLEVLKKFVHNLARKMH
jgi:hypothetical protein